MATPKKKKRKQLKRRRVNIKLSEKAQIVQKNDKIRVQQTDTLRKIQGRPPATVAPVFRVKIRKKQ